MRSVDCAFQNRLPRVVPVARSWEGGTSGAAGSVQTFAAIDFEGRAFQLAFDCCGLLAFAFLGGLLVILSPPHLGQDARFLAGALETPQCGVKMLVFSGANAGQTLFLGAKKTGATAGIGRKYTVQDVELQSSNEPRRSNSLKVLGIETSCDETGVAIYDEQRGLLSHQLYSQAETHGRFGGVVPELASRDHIRKLLPLVQVTLEEASIDGAELDAVAYTAGPGLIGALLVGGTVATGLAVAWGIPALPMHHMEAHLLAPLLEPDPPEFPFVALLVSGGHTMLVDVEGLGRYLVLGQTRDDAAGEAFDKTAKLLGLPYPGGPALAKLAEAGRSGRFALPRPMLKKPGLDFSFSGLKTAAMLVIRKLEKSGPLNAVDRADLATSFEDAAIETLVAKSLRALKQTGRDRLVVAGGVGANKKLREQLGVALEKSYGSAYYPRLEFCTDNGAMVAFAGSLWLRNGAKGSLDVQARARWALEEL